MPEEYVYDSPISPRSMKFSMMEKLEWPEDVFIGGGMLSRGDTMLIGAESKAGKSTFICGMIRQLISGTDFLGYKITRPLKVLYMQAELREKRLMERLSPTYAQVAEEFKDNLCIWSTRGIILFNEHLALIEREVGLRKPDILIIDPMLNFHNFNESNSQEMAEFFRMLDRIKETYDIAIIMAHHFRKASQDKDAHVSLLESIRGSSALRGWAVTTIAMEGRTESEFRKLEFEMRNSDEPIVRTIKYNKDTKDFDWHDPLQIITDSIKVSMKGQSMNTTDFISHLLHKHGELLSHNNSRAFEIKKHLLEYQVIKSENRGKAKYLSLA